MSSIHHRQKVEGQINQIPVFFFHVPSGYLTWPWKITMLLIGKPSISMGHGCYGYVKEPEGTTYILWKTSNFFSRGMGVWLHLIRNAARWDGVFFETFTKSKGAFMGFLSLPRCTSFYIEELQMWTWFVQNSWDFLGFQCLETHFRDTVSTPTQVIYQSLDSTSYGELALNKLWLPGDCIRSGSTETVFDHYTFRVWRVGIGQNERPPRLRVRTFQHCPTCHLFRPCFGLHFECSA